MLRSPLRVAATIAVLLYAGSGLYQVAPDESAVAFRLGRVVGRDVLPGIHWNPPWPVGRVVVDKTATNFIMPIGYRFQPRPGAEPISDLWLTGDTNVITARLIVQYRIKSLTAFVLAHEEPREIVRRAGERVLAELLSGEGVDGVLTTRRNLVPGAVRSGTQALLDELGVGVEVLMVSVEELAPPIQGGVRGSFQDVQNARSDRERVVHESQAEAARILAEARGEADRIESVAKSDRRSRVALARGESERFKALAVEYDASPEVTRERLYLETTERVLSRTKNFVVEPGSNGTVKLRVLR